MGDKIKGKPSGKVLLADHLYPIMNICILMGRVSSRMTPPTFTGHEDSLNGLVRM